MSLNVLVVSENPTYNGAILKPLCERLFAECGRTQANIEVLANPRTNGYDHAKGLFRREILDLYSHKHLVLFLPDSDGQNQDAEFAAMEAEFEREAVALSRSIRLICCAAVPELEAWLLAGHQDKWEPDWKWAAMRTESSFKETYFRRFIQKYGQDAARLPDQGRKQLMIEALRNYAGIRSRCEELQRLESRIRAHLVDVG
jgi:hypothetical protein